jgi:DNA modification methylase
MIVSEARPRQNRARSAVRLALEGGQRPAVPPVKIVPVGQGSGDLRLIQGDNWAALRALESSLRASVALAYLDPPFFTGRVHSRVARDRDRHSGKILRAISPAFDDRWADLPSYLRALRERLEQVRPLLLPTGCIVVHVDPRTSHYVKVLCDEVFGEDAFASEIVWRYRRWPSKTPNFQRVHDVLLRYVRDPKRTPRFVQLFEPPSASTLTTWGEGKQRAIVDGEGRRTRSSATQELSPGVPLGDVWEIGIIAPVAKERTGYPTQKPEALLKRLISACTRPGDIVLDPYAGSGTTLAVAAALGRKAIGIDESPVAIEVAHARLRKDGLRPVRERCVLARDA